MKIMVEDKYQKISIISCFTSDFSFEIHLSVKDLNLNEIYELRTFSPDGEMMGSISLKSDKTGSLVRSDGKSPSFGHRSSSHIKKGDYLLGINKGILKFDKKINFSDWKKLADEKYYIKFHVPYQNELTIKLEHFGNVPWGRSVNVRGKIYTKKVYPNSTYVYNGKKIEFSGTGLLPSPAFVNDRGIFSSSLQGEKETNKEYEIQAFFRGDEHLNQSRSQIISYIIVSHRTKLFLNIETLKLRLSKDQVEKIDIVQNENFRVTGKLNDIETNLPLNDKRVKFETNIIDGLLDMRTDDHGIFTLNQVKCKIQGNYYIKAIFKGDDLYDKSESKTIFFKVVESKKTPNNKIIGDLTIVKNEESSLQINPTLFHTRNLKIRNDLCFVLMPFEPPFHRIFNEHLKPILETRFKNVQKADDIYKSTPIIEDIWILINRARLIIADVTNKKSNVFYELGIAHTVGKEVIIITQNEKDIPFDIKHIRYIRYSDDANGWTDLKEKLKKYLESIPKNST